MLSNPTAGRKLTGRMMVLAAIGVALPLTATRAIHYVDVPMLSGAPAAPKAASISAVAPVAAVAQAAAPAAVAPVHKRGNLGINGGMVTMNGQTRQWKDLSPAEKAEVRKSLAEAREELSRVNRDEIQRNVREVMEEARISKEEFRREMAEARVEIDRAMREIDAHSADLRRAGQSPEQLKATVRASLKSVEAIDIDAITRNAMASVNEAQMESAMAAAREGLEKAQDELDNLDNPQD